MRADLLAAPYGKRFCLTCGYAPSVVRHAITDSSYFGDLRDRTSPVAGARLGVTLIALSLIIWRLLVLVVTQEAETHLRAGQSGRSPLSSLEYEDNQACEDDSQENSPVRYERLDVHFAAMLSQFRSSRRSQRLMNVTEVCSMCTRDQPRKTSMLSL